MSEIFEKQRAKIAQIRSDFDIDLSKAASASELEALRIKYLGKKSETLSLMKLMSELEPSLRPLFGSLANELRSYIMSVLSQRIQENEAREEGERLKKLAIDVTLPAKKVELGLAHPISQTIDLVSRIFIGMGYEIADGPELEFAKFNFDLLRIPQGHPSREAKDTFYVDDDILLRTQTSGVQVRVMQKQSPPIRIIAPGKVYRPDTPDATHSPIFHQIEGLVIDKGISMSDLVGTLQLLAKELFGKDSKIRLRPHHFPFTEPSCEVDVSCWRCKGSGCPTCKNEGYIEILGAGMVHPGVLENCGIDPNIYSGFAFGIGAERVCMARFDIDDIRNFYENNIEFLKQFA